MRAGITSTVNTARFGAILLTIATAVAVLACAGPQTQVDPPPGPDPINVVASAPTNTPLRHVVILNSYEPDYWGVIDQDKGITDGLATLGFVDGQNIKITRLYMYTKTANKSPMRMRAIVPALLSQLETLEPDVILMTDDDALVHVGAELLDSDVPIVFSGINGQPTSSNYSRAGRLAQTLVQPGYNITGVLERVSFKAGFELLHQIMPQAKTALFITDNSSTSYQVLKDLGGEAELNHVALQVVDKIYTDSFPEIKNLVVDYQDKVDAIVLFLAFTIVDEQGQHVSQEEVVGWLMKNSRRPSIAFWDVLAQDGYMVGVVADLEQLGYHAGLMAGRVLSGESPAQIPIIDPVANSIVLNLARADQLGVDIPFDILKSADKVYLQMLTYPEYQPQFE